jgi:dTMP kinase
MSSLFVTFEGVEGAGKSTQIALTHDWLISLGHRTVVTREPGGTELGKGLRQLLLQGSDTVNRAELLLFAADRAQHVETLIRPHLAQGSIVLCDRYSDSTIAYQHYGRGLDLDLIASLNQIATQGLLPDLTLWLDLDVEVGLTRAQSSGKPDRMERLGLEFHQRVAHGFQALAQQNCDRIVRIDASQAIDTIQSQIQTNLKSLITF